MASTAEEAPREAAEATQAREASEATQAREAAEAAAEVAARAEAKAKEAELRRYLADHRRRSEGVPGVAPKGGTAASAPASSPASATSR